MKRVNIEKRGGGFRPLGIPTVSDRIAQAVVKGYLEPELEKHFHPDSYGYRPGKSALDAVGVARERCWRYAWVLDLDIKSYFDRIAPEDGPYEHDSEGPDDMPAHLKTALTQVHLSVPVINGDLALGTWQGIYLFEHRARPHRREIVLHLIGE